ncbi:Protein N-acetyltransferase, RimJ/RimL family [Devosia sp. YR412]|uniref:GNAT family N-acetyltransferase n=1 Tax=Devosia sp. YR412 TaxID=1881030 RepID=UPI0008AF7A03|nr:GNAT family N-acetyltransferase [Devosia sp. YR412]SEQ26440.1 Protein N-acetyltransferase, RimJ/RimL family [Devosia sp. YR412]
MNITLRTPNFTLRPAQVGDAELIARYLNDFAVAGNLARVPFPYHLSDAKAWLGSRKPSLPVEETNFSIDLPGEGFAGHVGFHMGPQGPIIGYWLGQPFWGRGIMTEAVLASLEWFFDVTDADTIYSGVFHFNHASLAIQTKLGFTQTGRSTLLCLARGAEVEHIDTKLTRARFQQNPDPVLQFGNAAAESLEGQKK